MTTGVTTGAAIVTAAGAIVDTEEAAAMGTAAGVPQGQQSSLYGCLCWIQRAFFKSETNSDFGLELTWISTTCLHSARFDGIVNDLQEHRL